MKAIFDRKKNQNSAVNRNGDRELTQRIVVLDDSGTKRKLVDCRFYMGRSRNASVVYCSLWLTGTVSSENVWVSGSGKAGGHGYHKTSAAMQNAITAAGFTLVENDGVTLSPIDGRGDGAMRDAAIALAAALGYNDVILVE